MFPHWLNHSLRTALRALDFGEMSPLLEPIKVGKKRDLTQLRLQLIAVSMVAYRQGLGMKRKRRASTLPGEWARAKRR